MSQDGKRNTGTGPTPKRTPTPGKKMGSFLLIPQYCSKIRSNSQPQSSQLSYEGRITVHRIKSKHPNKIDIYFHFPHSHHQFELPNPNGYQRQKKGIFRGRLITNQ